MRAVTRIQSQALAFLRNHIDTDQILPARFMKTMSREGLGQYLFNDLRHDEHGVPRPECRLNGLAPGSMQILIAGENFGCGSSREHAVWALVDFGICCVIAPSFGDIFSANCSKNGLLLVQLPQEYCVAFGKQADDLDHASFIVDLKRQTITDSQGGVFDFPIDRYARDALLRGLDEIGRTLIHADAIADYEVGKRGPRLVGAGDIARG